MSNRQKAHRDPYFVPATYLGAKPGDFPVGSLQSRAAARAILTAYAEAQRAEEDAQLADLTPSEQLSIRALMEDVDEPRVRILMIRLYRVARETAKVYEQNLPLVTPEQIRHKRAIFKEIDRMTGGRASSLHMSNSIEWNRLQAIAEENLHAKKK
jgi:hypothetical protein